MCNTKIFTLCVHSHTSIQIIFLNLLRLVFWPNIRSSLENVLCVLEKNVYPAAILWNILFMSVMYICSIVWFKPTASLFILSLGELSIVESEVVKSPTIISLLFIYPFISVSICFIYLGAQVACINIYNCYILWMNWHLYHSIMTFFFSHDHF